MDSPHRLAGDDSAITVEESGQQQQFIVQSQDDQLQQIHTSVGTLKSISRQIGREIDEQAVMLDDLGNEIEVTDSRLDSTLKKVAKVLHLSNDRRQWVALSILTIVLIILVLLLFL